MNNAPAVGFCDPLEPRRLLSAAAPAAAAGAAAHVPRYDHVVIVIEENKSDATIIGSAETPYINSLAQQGATFTDYYAITHPSQPNYIALFSGSTQGVTTNAIPAKRFTAPSLGGQLIRAGFDFGGYSEDQPYTGFMGAAYKAYHRRHNPWSDFADVPSRDNMTFRRFPTPGNYDTLPDVSFVVPNLLHDMHDGTIGEGDDWLRAKLDPYVQWAKTHNSLFVLTWDEDDFTPTNRIPTIVVGPGVRPGAYSQTLDHYSLLRTLEDMYGLSHLGNAATARPIDMIWAAPESRTTHLAPSADTYVFDGSPTSSYGSKPQLDVKTSSARTNRDAYFKFDVSALSADAIGSVKLRFNANLSGAGRVATSVFAVGDTNWTEIGTTWNNRPTLGQSLGSTIVASSLSLWHEVDVTDYLKAQRAAGKRFVTLALHNTANSTPKIQVKSREATSDRPELLVVRS